MSVFTGLPQMVLFLAQVLFIVLQILILFRLTSMGRRTSMEVMDEEAPARKNSKSKKKKSRK